MSWFSRMRSLARGVFARRDLESEMHEEFQFHIERRTGHLIAAGLAPHEAARRARLEFGSVDSMKEQGRESRGLRLLDELRGDLRYAARTLRRSPGFALAAILTLALGIGANTAVFSVVNGVVLRPLPYPDAERVAFIGWNYGEGSSTAETAYKFEYVRRRSRVFEGVSTHRTWATEVGQGAASDEVRGLRATEDFFRVNGIPPALGRSFLSQEVVPNGPRVVVLSDELWRSWFNADPEILGTTVRLGEEPYTVVGVLPPAFRFPEAAGWTDFVVPFQLEADPRDLGQNHVIRARIRPDVMPEQVRSELLAVSQQFKREHPELVRPNETGIGAQLLEYGDIYLGGTERTLFVLLGAVGFVLLIACVNVANLLLARSSARQREMSVRAAIGAGRGRIARQLLTESLLLTTISAVAGLLIGQWSMRVLLAFAPSGLPRMDEINLDGRVLLFTLLVAVTTGIVFGLAAAVHALRTDLNDSLREGGVRQSASRSGLRLRAAFVAAETALAVVLLTGAGLLIATFFQLQSVDTGFDADNVHTVEFGRSPAEYAEPGAIWEFERQLLERMRALPGVTSAGAAAVLPFLGQLNFPMTVVGKPEATRGDVQWRSVSPDYFETLRARTVRGRTFTDADGAGSQPVAIINETFARKYLGDADPLGARIDIGTIGGRNVIPGFDDPERVIVGVVADTRVRSLDSALEEIMYIPRAQEPAGMFGLGGLVIRTDGPAPRAATVLAAIRQIDSRVPAPRFLSMRDAIGASLAQESFNMALLGTFAGLALLLTAIGIYGVVAYTVRQRTGEIGIRVALGASPSSVARLVLRQGMTPVVTGVVLGVAAAIALTRVISSLLFGVTPTDPQTIVAVASLIIAVALLSTWLPARRAAAVDPVVALKAE